MSLEQVFGYFVPYVMSLGADIAAMVEKCIIVDDKADYCGRSIENIPNVGCPCLFAY